VNDILPDLEKVYREGDTHGALTRLYDCIEELETLIAEGATVESVLESWKVRANANATNV
jgi:hypothetical protein